MPPKKQARKVKKATTPPVSDPQITIEVTEEEVDKAMAERAQRAEDPAEAQEEAPEGTGDEDGEDQFVRKKLIAEQLTVTQEEELAEWFSVHPIFYDQSARDFKDRQKKDRLLNEKAEEYGLTGKYFALFYNEMYSL